MLYFVHNNYKYSTLTYSLVQQLMYMYFNSLVNTFYNFWTLHAGYILNFSL